MKHSNNRIISTRCEHFDDLCDQICALPTVRECHVWAPSDSFKVRIYVKLHPQTEAAKELDLTGEHPPIVKLNVDLGNGHVSHKGWVSKQERNAHDFLVDKLTKISSDWNDRLGS